MASSIVSSAAGLLSKLLVEEAKNLYAVKDKVEALHDELTWMQAFLRDADTREDQDQIIRMWVSQIRDFAYEAEDIVEKYLYKVSRHRQDGIMNTLKWASCIWSDIKPLHGIGSDIDSLKSKISELTRRMQIYGVKPTNLGSFARKNRVLELRRTSSRINIEEIVGLKEDSRMLMDKLTNSDHKVVCITGMGGLGKTTLAKMVNEEIKHEFKNRVWVYVSQQFQTRNVLEAILLKLMDMSDQINKNIRSLRVDELFKEVRELLEKKRCLVFLDDIWSKDAWDTLAPAFTTMALSQSKLLLTTRNTNLLSYVDHKGFNYQAKYLTETESWELLKKTLCSRNFTSAVDEKMEELGKEMAKQCNGLPLAVVVLGGILATKRSLGEWEKVQENIKSCFKDWTAENKLTVAQVLELSYDDLPYYLKPCFLHLGSFPEDFEIPMKTLCRMWAIEGIVAQPTYVAAELEVTAENYLKELASRCLVESDRTGKDGKIKSVRLHDLIRDLCLKMSDEESFLKVIEHGNQEKQSAGRGNSSSSLPNQRFRRLVVYMHKSSNSLQGLLSEKNSRHVRSLLFFPAGQALRELNWTEEEVSTSLELIRILHFDNVCIRSLPNGVGGLIHLRYLSLKGTRVSRLPSSVGELKYLQILDLRVSFSVNMVILNVLWKLERLKHLYLPNAWLSVDFESLAKHPRKSNKSKLRLRGLNQLETLENLRLEECQVRDLLSLPKLSKVNLAEYAVTELESLNSFLDFHCSTEGLLKRPLSITVTGDVISTNPSILLSASQLQFRKLHISGKMSLRLRYARVFPQDLKYLVLDKNELKDDPMPYLESLSQLTELALGDRAFLGTKMVCAPGKFPQLAELRLVHLPELEEWSVGEGAMPNLKSLFIYSCKKLGMIPSELPLGVKIGCRPCVPGCRSCCYMAHQPQADLVENQDELPPSNSRYMSHQSEADFIENQEELAPSLSCYMSHQSEAEFIETQDELPSYLSCYMTHQSEAESIENQDELLSPSHSISSEIVPC